MSRLSLYANEKGKCVTHYDGFSWFAGLLPVIWALQRRNLVLIVASLVYGVGVNVIVAQFGTYAFFAIFLVQFAALGALGNRIHRALLERGGWLRCEEEAPPASRPAA